MITAIDKIGREALNDNIPAFSVGDSVKVHAKIYEGDKERIQVFAGTVIAKDGGGMTETFTVRRVSHGVVVLALDERALFRSGLFLLLATPPAQGSDAEIHGGEDIDIVGSTGAFVVDQSARVALVRPLGAFLEIHAVARLVLDRRPGRLLLHVLTEAVPASARAPKQTIRTHMTAQQRFIACTATFFGGSS
jgi:hypothetical protein